jgi:hypothetical protein
MILQDWANGNGQTLTLSHDESTALIMAISKARHSKDNRGNAVLDTTEIDVVIQEGE